MMNWRNIYVQNPYPTESSSRQRPQRYTPTRKQKTADIETKFALQCLREITFSRSHDKSLQKPTSAHKNSHESPYSHNSSHNHNKHRVKTTTSHKKNYVVTQQWIIKLKKQLSKLMQCVHSLVFMNKNNMHRIDKFLKSQSIKIKEDIMGKMNEIMNQIGLTGQISPGKIVEKNIGNSYMRVKTETVQQNLPKKQELITKEAGKQPFSVQPAQAKNLVTTALLMKPAILRETSILTSNDSESKSPQSPNNAQKHMKDTQCKGSIQKKISTEATTKASKPTSDPQANSKQQTSPPQRKQTQSPGNSKKPTPNKITTNPQSQSKNPQASEPQLAKPNPSTQQRYNRSKTTTIPQTPTLLHKATTESYNKVPEMKQTVKNINNCINSMSKMLQNLH